MNFTKGSIDSNKTEACLQKNGSSPMPINYELLGIGREIYWVYQSVTAVEGVLALVGNVIALLVVYRFEFLRENNGCRFIASLALADFLGGIWIFVSMARNILTNVFTSSLASLCKVEVTANISFHPS